MGRQKVQQNSLITGVISPTLIGRVDLDKYYNAVAEAENVVISPHGGMFRRDGTRTIDLVLGNAGSRLFSFEFSVTQNYIFILSINNSAELSIYIYLPNSDNLLTSISSGIAMTQDQLNEMDIIQSADTVIFTQEDIEPFQVQRQGSDTSWLLSVIPLTNIPKFDFDLTKAPNYINDGFSQVVSVSIGEIVYFDTNTTTKGVKGHLYKALIPFNNTDLDGEDYTLATWVDLEVRPNVWGLTANSYSTVNRGYPRTCTFHQGRLWFGGSRFKPTSVWGSVVNDFFNFDLGGFDVQPDDAIFDTLDAESYNAITNIISSRKLQVMSSSSEFINNADVITPSTSSWGRDTSYGSTRLRPVVLDGATYFVDRHKKTVRSYLFNLDENNYNANNISILAEHLLNDIQDLDILKGTSISSANTLYVVNGDGTLAVFNTMREENIAGWTKWTTQGNFKRVLVTGEIVTFIVERDGNEYIEVLDSNVLLDASIIDTNTDRVRLDIFAPVGGPLLGKAIKVVADTNVQSATNSVPINIQWYAIADRQAEVIYAGLNYDVKIKTLPVSANTQQGNFIYSKRRITRAVLNLYQSRGVYVNGELITNRKFGGDILNKHLEPITGIEKVYLLGYNTSAHIEITQINPEPMNVLAFELEVSF